MNQHRLTQPRWLAIKNNDRSADGTFFYGVISTHIFCLPSCPSRLPKRENIRIFITTDEATAAGFRPCKRCRPLGKTVTNQTWVSEIEQLIETNYDKDLSLTELAHQAHGAPYYLHRKFKEITGKTPLEHLTDVRLCHARHLLHDTHKSVNSIAAACGFHSVSHFITVFKRNMNVTPLQYRKKHRDVHAIRES